MVERNRKGIKIMKQRKQMRKSIKDERQGGIQQIQKVIRNENGKKQERKTPKNGQSNATKA